MEGEFTVLRFYKNVFLTKQPAFPTVNLFHALVAVVMVVVMVVVAEVVVVVVAAAAMAMCEGC